MSYSPQNETVIVTCLDYLIPEDASIRKVKKIFDSLSINSDLKEYYNSSHGVKGYPPEMLVRAVFFQKLKGIPSLRKLSNSIKYDKEARYLLEVGLDGDTPDFRTISNAFKNRFPENIFENYFAIILDRLFEKGLISAETIHIDSTETKASSNKRKVTKKVVRETAKRFSDELLKEVNEIRTANGKEPLKKEIAEEVTVVKPATDQDAGIFKKKGHQEQPAYKTTIATDSRGIVIAAKVTPGNEHDSQMLPDIMENIPENIMDEVKNVAADSAYSTLGNCKFLEEEGMDFYTLVPRRGAVSELPKEKFEYDKEKDCYKCPNGKFLKYSTTTNEGVSVYTSIKKDCDGCPLREKCLSKSTKTRIVTHHIWKDYVDRVAKKIGTDEHRRIYSARQFTVEPVFGTAKQNHGLDKTTLRGKGRVTDDIFCTLFVHNVKKLIKLGVS